MDYNNMEQITEEFGTENLLSLINIYLTEWCHRDELLWKQIYKYFYATLIVLFLPNISEFVGIELSFFPKIAFPAAALIMSVVFIFVGLGYAKRLAAIGDTYQRLINQLPIDLHRTRISGLTKTKKEKEQIKNRKSKKKIWNLRLSVVLCYLLFGCLIFLSIVMIIYYVILYVKMKQNAQDSIIYFNWIMERI